MDDHAQNIRIRTLPHSEDRLPLFIVGDVHGCAKELSQLIRLAKTKVSHFQLVLVGDLFTKGPDPVGIFKIIQEHQAVCIKGNHDWSLLHTLFRLQKKSSHTLPEHTQQTVYLIRHYKQAIFQFLQSLPHAYCTQITPFVERPGWENQYDMTIVHAGIDCTQGLERTPERMLLTVRYVRWAEGEKRLALVPSGYRKEALAELTGQPTLADRDGIFRWHELHQGPELIVFGHDAKQGLFRKTAANSRPICLGLDTGCTYGRCLTGYFPEFDDALQVPAQRTYFDIRRNRIVLRFKPKASVRKNT